MNAQLSNQDARRMWLASHGLAGPPTGPVDVIATIKSLGFVQIDTIRNVTRAHHHILWSRNQNYREKQLWPLLKNRALFEHFTHDASLIPMDFLPMWQRQFEKMGNIVARHDWYKTSLAKQQVAEIKARIVSEGPLSTHAFDSKNQDKREMWARPPHKKALEQMWYAGELATSHREKFVKFYDLAERVFPAVMRGEQHDAGAQVDWLCAGALQRLGFASAAEIARFWDAVSLPEARAWAKGLPEIDVQAADGTVSRAFIAPDFAARLQGAAPLSSRMRIINPFDPAIRDRKRLARLFGFEYRNEMFVPKAKRQWGYYVYPLLESGRFVGRIELKADRKTGVLTVSGFWPETGVKWSSLRREKLESELARLARFAGLSCVKWAV